jgi:hypothetical protein
MSTAYPRETFSSLAKMKSTDLLPIKLRARDDTLTLSPGTAGSPSPLSTSVFCDSSSSPHRWRDIASLHLSRAHAIVRLCWPARGHLPWAVCPREDERPNLLSIFLARIRKNGNRTYDKQAADIAIPLFGDAGMPFFAAAGVGPSASNRAWLQTVGQIEIARRREHRRRSRWE